MIVTVLLFSIWMCYASCGDPSAQILESDIDNAVGDNTRNELTVSQMHTVRKHLFHDPNSANRELLPILFKAQVVSTRLPLMKVFPYPTISNASHPVPQRPSPAKALQLLKSHRKSDNRYPRLTTIPAVKTFSCVKVNQAGFYADEDFGCQVFRRCDLNGGLTSYLCPIQTVFNQITLVCDWYSNVQCCRASDFYDYANSRLYHENWPLLDNIEE